MTWRVEQGDCLDLLKALPDGSVDAVVTDPPYGIALANHDLTGRFRKGNYYVPGDKYPSAGNAIVAAARAMAVPIVAFASPRQPWPGEWRSLLVWDKGPGVGGGGDVRTTWKQTWELIQVGGPTRTLNGGRDAAVLRFHVRRDEFGSHPNQKPVALMQYLIEKLTNPGDTILDPCCGSGSTGVACMQTGRNFIGFEIDPGYCEIARRRIADAVPLGATA